MEQVFAILKDLRTNVTSAGERDTRILEMFKVEPLDVFNPGGIPSLFEKGYALPVRGKSLTCRAFCMLPGSVTQV